MELGAKDRAGGEGSSWRRRIELEAKDGAGGEGWSWRRRIELEAKDRAPGRAPHRSAAMAVRLNPTSSDGYGRQ